MRKKKLIWLLYPTYVLIIFLCLLVLAGIMAGVDKSMVYQETGRHLKAQAQLTAHCLEPWLSQEQAVKLNQLCRSLGKEISVRITVIGPDGGVWADSQEDPKRMENHADRPEVQAALHDQSQTVQRHSFTVHEEMIYFALPFYQHEKLTAVIRLSIAEASFQKIMAAFYFRLAVYTLLVALVAVFISWLLARFLSRPLVEMRACAEAIARGQFDCRLPDTPAEEMQVLAQSLASMGKKIQTHIQEAVQQQHERAAILASMQEGVLAVNTDEKIITINGSAAAMFEVDIRQAEGRDFRAGIRHPDLQKFVSQALQSETPVQGEIILDAGDEEHTLLVNGSRWIDEQGKSLGAVLVLNDVSRLKALERIRRDFVANVSHELKTPITLIQGFVETLLDEEEKQPEESRKFLTTILKNAQRLHAIIDDLLQLAKIEQMGQNEIVKTQVNLQEVVEESFQICAPKARDKNIELKATIPADLWVMVNAGLLQHALVNLVDNAIKYSPAGSPVLVEAGREGDEIHIVVRDWGSGIGQEHLPRLFERFYRVDKGRSKAEDGTGLGLAIVKHIVQAHGGSVSVRSSLGKGSFFTISLPVK